MPSRYHPIEDGLWDDDKFDALFGRPEASFEERAFFAFLSSNTRQRPSGIYRATNEQLSSGSRLPLKRVKNYLYSLHKRCLIVRDGEWIFLPGYLKRQSQNERLLIGAESDVKRCSSLVVLQAFGEKYPLHNRWSTDRQQTITRRVEQNALSEQSNAEQSNANQSTSSEEPPAGSDDNQDSSDPQWGTPEDLVRLYNEATPEEFSACTKLTPDRAKGATAILKIFPEREFWIEVFKRCYSAPFLRGQIAPTNGHHRFQATFDWFLQKDPTKNVENVLKVREGFYYGAR